jgi:hypothetical protein
MNRIERVHTFLKIFALLGLFLLVPRLQAAQSQPTTTCEDWAAVSKWTGTITITGSGQSTDQFGNVYKLQEAATIQFTTTSGPGNCGGVNSGWGWEAQNSDVKYSVDVQDEEDTTCHDKNDFSQTHPEKVIYSLAQGTFSTRSAGMGIDFGDPSSPKFFASVFQNVDGVKISYQPDPACGSSASAISTEPWGPALGNSGIIPKNVLPPTVSTLQGSTTYQGFDAIFGNGTSTWTVSWNIIPTVDLDVVLTIPDYATWRPSGGRTEKDFGGGLIVQVEIYIKSTNKPTSLVLPDKFSFSLAQVSHEPGVALNWPAKSALASPSPPDLSFDESVNRAIYSQIIISPDGTTADIPLVPSDLISGAVLLLGSHDWGGWATLNVNVRVAGQVIKGHFLGDPTTDILIPKRQAGSFIADNWKTLQNISLTTPDNDDSENAPVGDGNKGDGLTLYEEYRGFYLGCARNSSAVQPEGTPGATCKHVEGDPNTKDLFVASELSAQQELGIKKFKTETKLNVHYKGLSLKEIGTDHLINFNFGVGPHLQNDETAGQHALYVHWNNKESTSKAVGGPGVPRKITEIYLGRGSELLTSTNPSSNQGSNYYTATVAHELSHGVDVWHHGEYDRDSVKWYADQQGQVWETKVDQQGTFIVGTAVAIQVFTELQDPRTAIPTGLFALGLLEDCPEMNDTCPPKTGGIGVNVANHVCSGIVKLGGQHSGDQDCYMRYDNAEAYIPSGYPNVRYYPVDEITGLHLTDKTTGTFVNDPSHPTGLGPLSRYGDANAAAKRGNCKSQIDVNDLTDPPRRDGPSACSAN